MLYLFIFGPAILTYGCLAGLPKGRPALLGCVASVCTLTLILTFTSWSGEAYIGPVLIFIGGAIAFAAVLQIARFLLEIDRVKWRYPALAIFVLFCLALPLAMFSGI